MTGQRMNRRVEALETLQSHEDTVVHIRHTIYSADPVTHEATRGETIEEVVHIKRGARPVRTKITPPTDNATK